VYRLVPGPVCAGRLERLGLAAWRLHAQVGEIVRVAMNRAGGRRREGPPDTLYHRQRGPALVGRYRNLENKKNQPTHLITGVHLNHLPFPSSFAPCSPLSKNPKQHLVTGTIFPSGSAVLWNYQMAQPYSEIRAYK